MALTYKSAPTTTTGIPASRCFHLPRKQPVCAFLGFLEKEFEGEAYDSDFAPARVVWGCQPSL